MGSSSISDSRIMRGPGIDSLTERWVDRAMFDDETLEITTW
jgi:hypothetical protein